MQYGRITAFVIYLLHYQLLPENRLATLMVDLFGVKVATATIARMSRACADRLHDFVDTVRDLVAGAPVKHMDETGFRIGGKTQWLHVASTALLTFYRVCAKRGSLLANVVGIVVHDHWKPYYTIEGVLHALCNAHHLRELKALVEIEKEEWARKMQRLLRRACHITNRARERGVPLKPQLIECFERRYDVILAEGLAFHETQLPLVRAVIKAGGKRRGRAPRRTGHNLLLRLAKHKEDTLRFLRDPTVPFTNNQAERDGRMMKLRQKISGGFRSLQGAMDFALIRSFVSTARKQDWNIIDALSATHLTSPSPCAFRELSSTTWVVTKTLKFPEASLRKLRDVAQAGAGAIEIALRAGVKVGFGTDLLGETHSAQSREFTLRAQVQSNADVLRSATVINAALLERPGRLGVLKPGALADLLLVIGNPLEDLAVLIGQGERIDMIMRGGVTYKNTL